jgi:hypothetical protein
MGLPAAAAGLSSCWWSGAGLFRAAPAARVSQAMKNRRLILLLLAAPVVLVLVLELVFRLGEERGVLPPVEVAFINDLPGLAREARWRIDSNGLRGASEAAGRPAVLCVGNDSTMAILQSDPATWWGRLAPALEAAGRPAAVAATGSTMGTAAQCMPWMKLGIAQLKPKVVVLAFGPGEVLARPAGFRFEPAAMDHDIGGLPGGWKGTVLKLSAIARKYRNARIRGDALAQRAPFEKENALRDRFAEEHQNYLKAAEADEIPWVHEPADEISASLSLFHDRAKAAGFTPLVVWLPWPHRPGMSLEERRHFRVALPVGTQAGTVLVRPDPGWVDGRLRAFRMRAEAVCAGLGIGFIDAATALETRADIHFDEVQLNDAGAAAVAGLVAPAVGEALAR